MNPLTHNQITALLTAVFDSGFTGTVYPHGVYRSLVIRGMLQPKGDDYQITPEGRERIAAEVATVMMKGREP